MKQLKDLTGRDYKREIIRIYFNHTCQKCGKVWDKKSRRLDVHHINQGNKMTNKYDKDVDYNKVTLLCHKCHLNLPEHRNAMTGERVSIHS